MQERYNLDSIGRQALCQRAAYVTFLEICNVHGEKLHGDDR